jgi:hypothetical protein
MFKNIIFILVIPFIILASNDFETIGFVVAVFYLLYYFAKIHPEPSSNNTYQNSPKELERKRKAGYDAWLEKSRKDKLLKTVKVKNVSSPVINVATKTPDKFTMSQSEFETEINNQLNEFRVSYTKILWVGDEHRKHPWSKRPGGCTVVVLFKDRVCKGYDKVKRPDRYTMKITKDYISDHYSNARYSSLEKYISEIYLTSERGVDLNKVWHSNMKMTPWEILEEYRTM